MSTQRGNFSRTRAQKHKNSHGFRNDLHDKTPQQKMLNNLQISEVCQHCKGVLEWKIKYKKYKPLSQPKTCTNCMQRNIVKAYHVLCRDCARAARVCAKCLKSADEQKIVEEAPSQQDELKLKAEMKRLVKILPERKRRTFWRFMKKGKQVQDTENSSNCVEENSNEDESEFIPYTREELLDKFKELQTSCNNDQDEFDYEDYADEDDDSDDTSEENN